MENAITYSPLERMAFASMQFFKDGENVFIGAGFPLAVSLLAKKTVTPNIKMIYEGGAFDSRSPHLPLSIAGPTIMYQASTAFTTAEIYGFLEERGFIDMGFIGGAQIDKYGNLNSTFIGSDYFKPKARLPGSGGAGDISTFSKRSIVILPHAKKRFVDNVHYLTSIGWKVKNWPSGEWVDREALGIPGKREAVITTMGVLKFDDETKEIYLDQYFEGHTPTQIKENTGFDLDVSRAKQAEKPDPKIMKILREEVDPGRLIIK